MSTEILFYLVFLALVAAAPAFLLARRWAGCRLLGHRVGVAETVRQGGSVVRTSACVRCGARFRGEESSSQA